MKNWIYSLKIKNEKMKNLEKKKKKWKPLKEKRNK
jgi:hypothetical protein